MGAVRLPKILVLTLNDSLSAQWSSNAGGQGRDAWHTTSSPGHRGAYSTNFSLSNGSYTGVLYHRRERPDLLFDPARLKHSAC